MIMGNMSNFFSFQSWFIERSIFLSNLVSGSLHSLILNLKSPHTMQFFIWNACVSVRTPGFLHISHGSSDFCRVYCLYFEYVLQSRRCFVPAATQVILGILHIFCKSVLAQQTALRRSSERISSECGKKIVSCSVNLCFSGKATI